jgi:hypothetical protein
MTTKGVRDAVRWFVAKRCFEDGIEATRLGEPNGETERYDIASLSDWMILSPAGTITSRTMTPARAIRERKDEMRASMREAREKR